MAEAQANIRTFITPLVGPGRLAPTLLEDLCLYDPELAGGLSLLRDNPFDFITGDTLGDHVPPAGCRHEFWLKARQSNVPELDERPIPDTRWRVAVMCCKCRVHLTIDINYTTRWQPDPCPNPENPLHHLIRVSEWLEKLERDRWEQNNPGRRSDIAVFECSSQTCSAKVMVRYNPPEIDLAQVDLLVSKEKLQQRTQDAFRIYAGNTQGMKQPQPIDVLRDLRIYVENSWNQDSQYRTIKLANKRFVVRFGPNGEPCRDILESFGFKLDETQECWRVPEPDFDEPLPLSSQTNTVLDNLVFELLALISQRPPEELQQHPDLLNPVSAVRDLERVLSCQNYDKHPAARRTSSGLAEAAETRTMPYNCLGVPQSASDQLIIQAYQKQMQHGDRRSHPNYLESLRIIGVSRSSEIIQETCVLEISSGRYDVQTLVDSYRSIGLELNHDSNYDDHYIIGVFNSRLEDMRKHERDLRGKLRIIGDYRASRTILENAENMITTYEQALLFLGADESVSDDQITALFGAKVGDNKNLESQARRAVSLIADHRHSVILHNWINSGFTAADLQMTAVEGYQALQIDNRTVEDELIVTQYDFALGENPGNAEYYTKALDAIAKERDSIYLRNHLQQTVPQPAQGSTDEPVGLDNIGNTCYLNSLLQFLFTMLELRQVVLDFDQYKMELTESNMQLKKVGQRRITNREVQTAQKFVGNLALLFKGMIETPQPAIRPEKELARLTLESDSAKERVRRRSTLKGDRPSLGHIDSQPVLGPLPMPDTNMNSKDDDSVLQSPQELGPAAVDIDEVFGGEDWHDKPNERDQDGASNKDNSSEATLVSETGSVGTPVLDSHTVEEQQAIMENKENLSPIKEKPSISFDDQEVQPLAPASPSKVNMQAGVLDRQDKTFEVAQAPMVYAPPPGKPPPVPPRKPVEPSTDILEEYARQQDVTEVIAHCLFQFSCAIRPTGVDSSGEQLDEIHDMFFGRNISHVMGGKEAASPVQFFSIITRVANEPNDVYAALDTEYDLSLRDNGTSAFLSIAKPPPVFSIALDRVVWDSQAKRPTKLNHHVQVPETIFLDRYLESSDGSDLMARRLQTWQLKKELSSLNERRNVLETQHANTSDLPQLFDQAKSILEHLQSMPDDPRWGGSLDIPPNLITTFGTIAEDLKSELEALKLRIADLERQIKEAFADMRKHPYRLHAAFFHRGSAGGGHYWVYIYDHKKEIWRSYNDDRVNVVQNLNEIFGKPPTENAYGYSTPANPYFLVYVKDDETARLVESVKRDIVYPPPIEPPPMHQFSGFGASVQPMSQVAAMPPAGGSGTGGEVEMVEYGNVNGMLTPSTLPPPPLPERQNPNARGTWDEGRNELIRPSSGW